MLRLGADLAPRIAEAIITAERMPAGSEPIARWVRRFWPHATPEQIRRAYDIAAECWEDDYLFEHADHVDRAW